MTDVDTRDVAEPVPSPVRPRRARLVGQLLCGVALAGIAFLVLTRLTGLDAGTVLALPIAGLPYVAVATAVVLLVLVGMRSWRLALVALVLVATQVAWLTPRFVADGTDIPADASRLRVATCNTHKGRVDPAALVALVRANQVDVLALAELPADRVRALDAAGMRELMPYRELHPETDSSIYSRLPLSSAGLLNRPTTWPQTTATVTVAGRPIRLVAVHTYYPAGNPQRWTLDMQALRDEAAEAGEDLVVLGDFNATLDHAAMRSVLAAGLVDTHAELGQGWAPTWPANDSLLPPLIQIDHVLHGRGLAAVAASEHTLPGTDHRAVVAELALLR